MADDELINQNEIEKLLQQSPEAAADKSGSDPAPPSGESEGPPPGDSLGQDDIESLLNGAASASAGPEAAGQQPEVTDADKLLGQDDIERLLNQAGATSAAPAAAPPKKEVQAPSGSIPTDAIAQGDVEFLLNQAENALASIDSRAAGEIPSGVVSFQLPELTGTPASAENATLDLIRDVELDLKIELGRTHMYLEDILKLRRGSVVPLDKLAGDPVDIYANDRLIARGEVLVLNDNFCVRVGELISGNNPEN